MNSLIPIIALLFSTALVGMNEASFIMARVFDEPTRDTREMKLTHGEDAVLLHVDRNVAIGIEEIEEASASKGPSGAWLITLKFTEKGKEKLSQLTKRSLNKRIAILIDGELISAPVVRDVLTGGIAQITGQFDQAFADDFVKRLNGNAIQSEVSTPLAPSSLTP